MNLETYLARRRKAVDGALNRILTECVPKGRLFSAMSHSLNAGGKRLRPILCMAAADAVGGSWEDALYAGCAIELIHTYSLVHDDLPAIDNDDLRRGKPSCHAAFDEATAIFAGDALHTLAFEVLSSDRYIYFQGKRRLAMIHLIADATGNHGMIEGQMRDILAQGKTLTLEQLKTLHRLKTGALIAASVHVGALIGGGTARQIKKLAAYAENIGLAFQVADDLLNVEGDSRLTGKATGTDRTLEKATYPGMIGIDASREFAAELAEKGLQAIDSLGIKADPLRAVAKYVIERKA